MARRGEMETARDDETPRHERKRLRVEEVPSHPRWGTGAQRQAPAMLPFVSPERPPRERVGASDARLPGSRRLIPPLERAPLQVRAIGISTHAAVPSPVQDHMTVTRKKVRSSISAHKKHAMRQLERQYQALREKILAEIGDAEEQFKVLQQANDSINEKTDRKLQAMAKLASSEIMKIEKARATAVSSTAQLLSKEKQKILQRFDAEMDALVA